jgi:hypothetical protein
MNKIFGSAAEALFDFARRRAHYVGRLWFVRK